MKLHDALARIVDAISVDEATRHDLHAAVSDHFADDIDALSDDEKSARRAPVDRLSGTVPALFVGGLTQDQFDRLIEQAADRLIAKRNGNGATKSPDALAAGDKQTAQIAAGQQPTGTAQTPIGARVPGGDAAPSAPDAPAAPADMTADEQASYQAWRAANQRNAAPTNTAPPTAPGNGPAA